MPSPAAVPVRRRRGPGGVAGRRAVVPGLRRSDAAGAHQGGHRQRTSICASAVARVEEARARAGIAKSFLYPQVDGVAELQRAAGVERPVRTTRRTTRTRPTRAASTASSCRGSSTCSVASGAQNEAATGPGAGERAGPPRRARHARRRRRVPLLPAARARPAARHRASDARASTTRRSPISRTVSTAACRIGSSSIESSPIGRGPLPPFPDIEQQIAIVENTLSLLARHGRRGRSRARRLTLAEPVPPPIPPGLPASLLERRPDVVQAEQFLVAANADIGVAKALFFPTISLTGFLGGVSGDLTKFLGGDGAVWSIGLGTAAADLPGGTPPPESRGDAGAFRRGARRLPEGRAQRLPRGGQLARDDSEAGRGAHGACRWESLPCRMLPTSPDRATIPGLPATSRSSRPTRTCSEQQLLLAQTRGAELRARAELYRTLGGGWQF